MLASAVVPVGKDLLGASKPAQSPQKADLGAMWKAILLLPVVLQAAHGYTDPGSGALMFQLAAAGFIGMGFYVRRILLLVRRAIGGR